MTNRNTLFKLFKSFSFDEQPPNNTIHYMQLGDPIQVRLTKDCEREIKRLGAKHGLESVAVIRLAISVGLPILKRKLK
jgi:hypothetical protein